MILLYKDPKGAQVGTTLQITTDATQTVSGGTERTNLELESKVASLEKLISELRNENETLKVSDSNSNSVRVWPVIARAIVSAIWPYEYK